MRIAIDGIGWIAVSKAAAAMPIQRVLENIKPRAQAVIRAAVVEICVPLCVVETVQKTLDPNGLGEPAQMS